METGGGVKLCDFLVFFLDTLSKGVCFEELNFINFVKIKLQMFLKMYF